MAASGYERKDVAAEFGVSVSAVVRMCRRYGIRFPHGARPNPDRRYDVMRAVQDGCETAAEIGRRVGRSRQMVRRWVRELEDVGALVRTGKSKGTRLSVSPLWAVQ